MNSSTVETTPVALPASASHRSSWARWAPTVALIGFFWLLVLNQQRLEWTVNPVYSYGWAVPALAICLFVLRWAVRPEPGAVLPARWFAAGVALVLAAYIPARIVQEANPDWVKVNWLIAGLWVGLNLLVLARLGGAPYARHFVFPLLFCFTALPWPVWLEESLSQGLMRMNASTSAEVLTLLGTPALAQGNLVQVADRWVNVEEACSGIRSLQTAFMVALFLGEFHLLGWAKRLLLLAASLGAAFIVNLVRTIVLTHLAEAGLLEEWHDPVGVIAMVLCLALLWGLAEVIRPRDRPASATVAPRTLAPALGWAGALAGCVALVGAEGLTRGWYAMHENALPPPLRWELHLPREAQDFHEGAFAERMTALLKFDAGSTASWRTDVGDQWQMYYLEWQPGRVSRFLSSAHYPTVCLPATGMKLVAETGVWRCPIGPTEVPFTTWLFDEGGRDVYVFHAVIEDRPEGGTPLGYRQVSTSERLASVARGERNLGQRVVGIALRGPSSPSAARAAVHEALGPLLVAQAGPLSPVHP